MVPGTLKGTPAVTTIWSSFGIALFARGARRGQHRLLEALKLSGHHAVHPPAQRQPPRRARRLVMAMIGTRGRSREVKTRSCPTG